jgi:hypothetical protein
MYNTAQNNSNHGVAMQRPTIALIILLLFLFNLFLSTTRAQSSGSTTGLIIVTVKDSNGTAIVGATVAARQIDKNFIRSAQTDNNGIFNFIQSPPGNYEIKAEASGFAPQIENLTLTIGTTAVVEFKLSISEVSDVIEVKGSGAIDSDKTESSTNIERGTIDGLPINRRNFLDFAVLAPRVLSDRIPSTGFTATSGLSFNGQSGHFNYVTIDGIDNNDLSTGSVRSTFSQDAVQEFQVVSDNFSAEFGRSFAGIVNIVTRGGTNGYHGSLFLFNRNDNISARDAFAAFKPPFSQYQFGSTASGPIKRDKAFFFASFERLSIKQNNIVLIDDDLVASARRQGFIASNGPEPFSVGTTSVLVRTDLKLTDNDTFWARYNGGFTFNGAFEPFGGLIDETQSGTQRLNDNSIVLNNTYLNAKSNFVNETRFLFGRRQQDIFANSSDINFQILQPEGTVRFGSNQNLPQPREERIYQIVDNVTLTRGNQLIKFGADFQYLYTPKGSTELLENPIGFANFIPLDFSTFFGRPGLPSFTALQFFDPSLRTPQQLAFLAVLSNQLPTLFPGFPGGLLLAKLVLPANYSQSFGDPSVDGSIKLFSFFIQDDIKLRPNLLIKAGLRYDLNRITFAPNNDGNISPRLALSYHPSKLSNLNIHAAYGIFFGVIPGGTATRNGILDGVKNKVINLAAPFSILPYTLPGHHFPESDLPPSIPGEQMTIDRFDPNIRNSYSEQANLGFDYLIAGKTELSLAYNFVRGIKLLGDRDRVDITNETVIETESAFDSYYHALTISANRRFANKYGFLVSYVFSKAIDNDVDPPFLADQSIINVGFNSLFAQGNLKSLRGLSLEDVRNRFILSGIWDLSYTKNWLLRDFQFSGIINLNSGRPYTLLNNANGPIPGLGYNVGITPGFANVDLRLTRSITIKERFKIEAILEAFNLFNRVNIDPNNINKVFQPDQQGNLQLPPKEGGRFTVTPDRYLGALAPRQIQLGLRMQF